ncbi:MAG: TIGR04283 family arsenosugar biosynthesis glycosyltransferase [Pseudomonadota bacterium]
MVSVVIPTLNAERGLVPCLASLMPGVMSGLISQLVIADGGSEDATLQIADEAGADIVKSERGRGQQLAAGADAARSDWILFLHADTLLEPGWELEVHQFLQEVHSAGDGDQAAYFRFRLNDRKRAARWLERIVSLRCALLSLPYGDQGLLISSRHYRKIGGFNPIPLMEDVDLIRRIGRARLSTMHHAAVTSADRYRRDGYLRRMLTNAGCLTLWHLGVSPERIERIYR